MVREMQIKQATNRYLDAMMPGSKVNYSILLEYARQQVGGDNVSTDREWIKQVVQSRSDFMVFRGQGICKQP